MKNETLSMPNLYFEWEPGTRSFLAYGTNRPSTVEYGTPLRIDVSYKSGIFSNETNAFDGSEFDSKVMPTIVKAVNNHQALVAALTNLVESADCAGGVDREALEYAANVLDQVKQ